MKIAIYEPEPRVCGPMASAYHLQSGFRALGHDCDVITFTRSGKPSITWQGGEEGMRLHIRFWRRAPDIVAKRSDAAKVLRGYDRVILTDVRTISQDKDAMAHRSSLDPKLPDYFTILRDSGVLFTTALHGNNYPPKEVTFAHDLVTLPNFTGGAITYSPSSPDASHHLWPQVTWKLVPLPYQMVTAPEEKSAPVSDRVGITGRYIPNKGHQALAMAAGTGRFKADVELWGACSVGAGASQSFTTFEALTQLLQLDGRRHGNQPETPNGGDLIKPYPWDVTGPNGSISYKGPYQDPVATCRRLGVHLDLTAATFSDGMEYSQFEAIDAGCLQASVESMWNPEFHGYILPSFPVVFGEKKLMNHSEGQKILDHIATAVKAQIMIPHGERRTLAQDNRKVLARVHSPAKVAKAYLEVMK